MMSGNEKVKMDKKVFTLSDISEFSKKHFQKVPIELAVSIGSKSGACVPGEAWRFYS